MLRAIAAFEIRYQLRQPLFYVVTLVFALLTFGAMASDSVEIGGAIGNVHRNAPYVIVQWLGVMSVIAMFVTTAFVASAAQRDFENGTDALFFSKPIRKLDYLGGRFLGSFAVSVLVLVGTALGVVVGNSMPWLDPEQLGPFALAPYLYAFAVLVLPNLFFLGAAFFSLAALSRSLLFTYMGVVVLFAASGISEALLADIENRFVAGLVDPFGMVSFDLATRYWTVIEKNTALPDLGAGGLGINRLIWIAVGLGILVAAYFAFDPARAGRVRRRRRKLLEDDTALPAPALAAPMPVAAPRFSTAGHVLQFLHQARLETKGVLRSVLFLVLLGLGVLIAIINAFYSDTIFGTQVYPVTHIMLQIVEGTFMVLLFIIVTFYSGELVWKERALKLDEVYDALPIPTWVTLGAKLTALAAVIFALPAVLALSLIGYQVSRGYYNIEPGLYVQSLLISLAPFLLVAVLAVFLQAATNSKFLGYLFMLIYLISEPVLSSLEFDHRLYRFAGAPRVRYSDMNGFGHFLVPFFWFTLYWTFFALLLYGLSLLFKARGTDSSRRARLRQAKARFRGPVRALLATALVGFVATGAWIFYNTNVLNEYVPGDEQEERQADYEKKYRKYIDIPMPRITAVRTEVDIYPRERRMEARGRYRLVNKTARPIDTLPLSLDPRVEVRALRFPAHRLVEHDEMHGYSIYRLERPLAPGAEMTLEFDVAVAARGFANQSDAVDTAIVYNGTFFNNRQFFPYFGYDEDRQLVDRNDRRKHGLPPVHRMAKVNDDFARRNTYLARDSDWVDFETVVSTSPDQIALAPGYLQREWIQNGRRYFHYKMDAPILHFYSYLSADYEVKRDRWKDVAIEIYYHEPHTYNVDRMIDSVKKSLDYLTANFSPYQHRQVRILEFPRYATFAQSFPNTIPFSESIGFIADLRDEEEIDYVFYVTAHEVAHQWWAHQVIGGNVQGATMLSETMSQYSALMIMEKEYGKDKMRRFLKYELDNYLRSRGSELVEEMPLMLVENQPYIHYRKGSVVLYGLKDYIGEEALNGALRRYVQAVAFQQPPYTNTVELMKYVEEVTPPRLRYVLDDMFRTITLFENRVAEATYRRRADGRYDVDLTLEARKVRADGQGVETPVQLDDWIDVGVFAEEKKGGKTEEKPLYFEKHRITQPRTRVRLTVDALPVRAGIDPYNKLVDRDSDDNRKKVAEGEGARAR